MPESRDGSRPRIRPGAGGPSRPAESQIAAGGLKDSSALHRPWPTRLDRAANRPAAKRSAERLPVERRLHHGAVGERAICGATLLPRLLRRSVSPIFPLGPTVLPISSHPSTARNRVARRVEPRAKKGRGSKFFASMTEKGRAPNAPNSPKVEDAAI